MTPDFLLERERLLRNVLASQRVSSMVWPSSVVYNLSVIRARVNNAFEEPQPETANGIRNFGASQRDRPIAYLVSLASVRAPSSSAKRSSNSSNIFSGQHRKTARYAQIGRSLLETAEEVFVVAARTYARAVC